MKVLNRNRTDRGAPTASTDEIMLVQETMKTVGLYSGAIDGIPGPATKRAVKAYKRSRKMPADNSLSDDFIEHLRNDT